MNDLDAARTDAIRSSGRGIGFLLAFGFTMAVVTILAFTLPVTVAALAFLFQGGVALPLAFFLERRLGFPPMDPANPLRPLVVQMAMVQVVALPAILLVYALDPAFVPAAFAAVGGGHFLPYAWLHRTRIYVALGLAASLVPFALMIVLGRAGFPFVPLALTVLYLVTVVALRATGGRGAPVAGGA